MAKGDGTGAGGAGSGTGSGASGSGSGGGLARKAEKIAGDIKSARDYPAASRDERIGKRVVIVLTVGTDGRVAKCRIWRPSGVPDADAVTCRLAQERFRFRPATDSEGNAQPRDSDPRAAYAILDTERSTWLPRRVPYPIEVTQAHMRAAGLPERLINRLDFGW